MKSFYTSICFLLALCSSFCSAEVKPPAAFGPVPSENQLKWQELEYYGFIHFSLNTYTDASWGYGNEDIKLFNPEKLDARQWARIAKQSGMKGLILVAKHHGGFAMWPSKYTEYSVKNAPWKNGKGDLVREVADACKEYGLKFGVYLSPWDRNRADYGKPEYITYFRNQLTELLTNYGPIFEIWFDGANGGNGYYGGANETRVIDPKTYYDWQTTYALVRKLQPNIVIWNDNGDRADLRWVGTESGYVGETNWSLLNAKGDVTWNMLHYGLAKGDSWVAAEVNTSIRPEWFYHPNEDEKVKTVPHLMDIYYNSVGRNATLLLNFPIMPNGLIHENDEKSALGMAAAVKESFAVNLVEKAKVEATNIRGNAKKFDAKNAIDSDKNSYWSTDGNTNTASLNFTFDTPITFNRFTVQEYIRLGQRVSAFNIEAFVDDEWRVVAKGTTIGYKRILRFPSVTTSKVRLNINESKSSILISNIGIYNAPLFLSAPTISRNKMGDVSISTNDIGPYFYYTLDGSTPTASSNRYTGPIAADGKVQVKAIAYDFTARKTSAISTENFDISKKDWKVLGVDEKKVEVIFDGDATTIWHQSKETKLPADLVVDLGGVQRLSGFKYLPDAGMWQPGVITHYEFFTSLDNKSWKLVDKGEFPNIKNNPTWQLKHFAVEKARYFKLRANKLTDEKDSAAYAEVDVITE